MLLLRPTVILLCVTLSACSYNQRRAPKSQLSNEFVNVESNLLETATSVEKSLAELAATQQSKHPPLLNTAPLVTPEGGMGGTADIDWTGPIAPLISKVSDLTRYRMKILGSEPAIPVIVSITQKGAVLADILKNAGMQAGRRASIMVYPETRVIELRYHQS